MSAGSARRTSYEPARWVRNVASLVALMAVVTTGTQVAGPQTVGPRKVRKFADYDLENEVGFKSRSGMHSVGHGIPSTNDCSNSGDLPSIEAQDPQRLSIHFDADSPVKRGGFGEVRRARLEGHDEEVAVKALRRVRDNMERTRVEIVSHGTPHGRLVTHRVLTRTSHRHSPAKPKFGQDSAIQISFP